jgi:hypothetical protein
MKFDNKKLTIEVKPRKESDKGSYIIGIELTDGYCTPKVSRFKIYVI